MEEDAQPSPQHQRGKGHIGGCFFRAKSVSRGSFSEFGVESTTQFFMLPDNTALVDAPIQLDHNLPRPVIVDVLKFVNVTCTEKHRCQNGLSCEGKGSHTMFLHDLEELDDNLRYRTN